MHLCICLAELVRQAELFPMLHLANGLLEQYERVFIQPFNRVSALLLQRNLSDSIIAGVL